MSESTSPSIDRILVRVSRPSEETFRNMPVELRNKRDHVTGSGFLLLSAFTFSQLDSGMIMRTATASKASTATSFFVAWNLYWTQAVFTCSKLTIKALKQSLKYVQSYQ